MQRKQALAGGQYGWNARRGKTLRIWSKGMVLLQPAVELALPREIGGRSIHDGFRNSVYMWTNLYSRVVARCWGGWGCNYFRENEMYFGLFVGAGWHFRMGQRVRSDEYACRRPSDDQGTDGKCCYGRHLHSDLEEQWTCRAWSKAQSQCCRTAGNADPGQRRCEFLDRR